MSGKVLDLNAARVQREKNDRFRQMDKMSLLEGVVDFQHRTGRYGDMPNDVLIEGIALFGALYEKADTDDMKQLCSSYCRHLKIILIARGMSV